MIAFFNLTLTKSADGTIGGTAEQLHKNSKWHCNLAGKLDDDHLTLSLLFPGDDDETWLGEIVGDSIKVRYQRKVQAPETSKSLHILVLLALV